MLQKIKQKIKTLGTAILSSTLVLSMGSGLSIYAAETTQYQPVDEETYYTQKFKADYFTPSTTLFTTVKIINKEQLPENKYHLYESDTYVNIQLEDKTSDVSELVGLQILWQNVGYYEGENVNIRLTIEDVQGIANKNSSLETGRFSISTLGIQYVKYKMECVNNAGDTIKIPFIINFDDYNESSRNKMSLGFINADIIQYSNYPNDIFIHPDNISKQDSLIYDAYDEIRGTLIDKDGTFSVMYNNAYDIPPEHYGDGDGVNINNGYINFVNVYPEQYEYSIQKNVSDTQVIGQNSFEYILTTRIPSDQNSMNFAPASLSYIESLKESAKETNKSLPATRAACTPEQEDIQEIQKQLLDFAEKAKPLYEQLLAYKKIIVTEFGFGDTYYAYFDMLDSFDYLFQLSEDKDFLAEEAEYYACHKDSFEQDFNFNDFQNYINDLIQDIEDTENPDRSMSVALINDTINSGLDIESIQIMANGEDVSQYFNIKNVYNHIQVSLIPIDFHSEASVAGIAILAGLEEEYQSCMDAMNSPNNLSNARHASATPEVCSNFYDKLEDFIKNYLKLFNTDIEVHIQVKPNQKEDAWNENTIKENGRIVNNTSELSSVYACPIEPSSVMLTDISHPTYNGMCLADTSNEVTTAVQAQSSIEVINGDVTKAKPAEGKATTEDNKTYISPYMTDMTYTYEPEENYQLKSITVNGEPLSTEELETYKDSYTFENLIGTNNSIVVEYEPIVYSVSTKGTNVTITESDDAVMAGSDKIVSWQADDKYEITKIVIDGKEQEIKDVNKGEYTFTNIQENHSIEVEATAKDEIYFFNIDTQATNATVTDSIVEIPWGSKRIVTWSASPGYRVKSVSVDGELLSDEQVAVGQYEFTDIQANHKVKVTAIKLVNIETSIENGTITESMKDIDEGTTQDITFTANEGYEITEIQVDGQPIDLEGITDSYTFESITEDHTIHVICTKIKEEVPIPEEPITPEEPTKPQEKTPTQQEQKRDVPKTGLHNSPTPYIIGGVVVLIVAGIIIVLIRKNHNE